MDRLAKNAMNSVVMIVDLAISCTTACLAKFTTKKPGTDAALLRTKKILMYLAVPILVVSFPMASVVCHPIVQYDITEYDSYDHIDYKPNEGSTAKSSAGRLILPNGAEIDVPDCQQGAAYPCGIVMFYDTETWESFYCTINGNRIPDSLNGAVGFLLSPAFIKIMIILTYFINTFIVGAIILRISLRRYKCESNIT